jgi:hypothetical protein
MCNLKSAARAICLLLSALLTTWRSALLGAPHYLAPITSWRSSCHHLLVYLKTEARTEIDYTRTASRPLGAARQEATPPELRYRRAPRQASPLPSCARASSAMSSSADTPRCPRKKRAILSLDGGGMKGALTACVLEVLEEELRAQSGIPDLLIAECFDAIVGTSTGECT